jgi:hypothetical protein
MFSWNQNWRFYFTSRLLGNWDRLEITVTYSSSLACPHETRIGGFILPQACWATGRGLKSPHLHVLREPKLKDLLDLKLDGQLGQA